jgi:hypothetical protein
MIKNNFLRVFDRYIMLALAGGSLLLSFFLPLTLLDSNKSYCLMQLVFHKPCPVCGMTRSFISLAHFKFLEAVKFNLAGVFWFFFIIIYVLLKIGIILKIIKATKMVYNIIYFSVMGLSAFTLIYWIIRLI